jgi:hypothetical protein
MTAARGTEGEDRLIPCLASLVVEELSPKTVDGYRRACWPFAAGLSTMGTTQAIPDRPTPDREPVPLRLPTRPEAAGSCARTWPQC